MWKRLLHVVFHLRFDEQWTPTPWSLAKLEDLVPGAVIESEGDVVAFEGHPHEQRLC